MHCSSYVMSCQLDDLSRGQGLFADGSAGHEYADTMLYGEGKKMFHHPQLESNDESKPVKAYLAL